MAKDKYIIEAYPYKRPETIVRGVIEKGSGQTRLEGEPINVLNRRAEIGVPNWTEAWGVRLDKEGKVPASPIDIKDPNYRGQISLLEWGDKTGSLIVCRFLRGFNTIDQQYQDVVLGAKDQIKDDNEASADGYYLRLQSGDNYYDPETDPYLVMMLRAHYMNENSKYKNPQSQSFMFRELVEKGESEQAKVFDDKVSAMRMVQDAAKDNSYETLRNLSAVLGDAVDQILVDGTLFSYISMIAEKKPDIFHQKVSEWKKKVSDSIEMAKSYNILDLTKNGHIACKDGAKVELLASDVPGKGDEMAVWMVQNFMEPKAFQTFHKLKNITDKLK